MSKASNEWNKAHREKCREVAKLWRKNNPEQYKANKKKSKLKCKANGTWTCRNKAAQTRRSKERYPEKWQATYLLNQAVKKGNIIRPKKCQLCNEIPNKGYIYGHHKDYSKPLEVVWVCWKCHGLLHSEEKVA